MVRLYSRDFSLWETLGAVATGKGRKLDPVSIVVLVVSLLDCTSAISQGPTFVGRASCASATCHGGMVDHGPAWNHSLTKWLVQDPHAGAGLLLRDDDSRKIVVALQPTAADNADAFDQVLRERCISCHTTATISDCTSQERIDDVLLARGVSCESCHGAAGNWIDAHVHSTWSGDRRFSQQTGMLDTETILGRAEGCVRCHVGSRTANGLVRDMNHDLIAAGHPPLRFDLLLYNQNLPSHWDVESESQHRFDESALRVRSVGRAMSLSVAAALSGQRANDHQQDPTVPWPELSDYDCFACHQSISMDEYRLPSSQKRRSPLQVSDGLPIWNAWHTIGQKELSTASLRALAPNRIDEAAMATAAIRVSGQYRGQAAGHAGSDFDPRAAISRLRTVLESAPPRDWHEAAIQYLFAEAAERDFGANSTRIIERVEPLLRFQNDGTMPSLQSPARFDPKLFREAMLDALPQIPDDDIAATESGVSIP